MPRSSDPSRKPQLIAEILEFLMDRSLSSVSFRTIAQALGVSTYTLVYQFGTRAQLLHEIVAAVSTRRSGIEEHLARNPGSIDAYFDGLLASWAWTIVPRNRQLQRLEFEASLIEVIDSPGGGFSRNLYAGWHEIGVAALQSLGLAEKDARVEARAIIDAFYGLQFDFVLNGDVDEGTEAFEAAMDLHRARVEVLMGEASAPSTPSTPSTGSGTG